MTVQYRQDNGAVIPMRVHTIVISVQHNEDITLEDMRRALKEQVIRAVVPAQYLDEDTILPAAQWDLSSEAPRCIPVSR